MTTDNQSELLTQVDEYNNIMGPIERGIAHNNKNIYYRTVYILVLNDKREVLIQKRSATKDLYPNCWDLSVGGHVIYGDTYEATAVRELEEELGITADVKKLTDKGQVLVTLPTSNEYFRVYEYNLAKSYQITAADDEIEQVRWMTLDAIKVSMKNATMEWYPRPLQTIQALY